MQMLPHALEMDEPAAELPAWLTKGDGADLPVRDQAVKRAALDPELALHVLPAPELGKDSGCGPSVRLPSLGFGC